MIKMGIPCSRLLRPLCRVSSAIRPACRPISQYSFRPFAYNLALGPFRVPLENRGRGYCPGRFGLSYVSGYEWAFSLHIPMYSFTNCSLVIIPLSRAWMIVPRSAVKRSIGNIGECCQQVRIRVLCFLRSRSNTLHSRVNGAISFVIAHSAVKGL